MNKDILQRLKARVVELVEPGSIKSVYTLTTEYPHGTDYRVFVNINDYHPILSNTTTIIEDPSCTTTIVYVDTHYIERIGSANYDPILTLYLNDYGY